MGAQCLGPPALPGPPPTPSDRRGVECGVWYSAAPGKGASGSAGGRVAALPWTGQLGQETGLTATGHIPNSALTDQFT